MSAMRQRVDQYAQPDGTVKILPCACDEYTQVPCLYHWAQDRAREAGRPPTRTVATYRKEEDYVNAQRGPAQDRAVRSGSQPSGVRGNRGGDGNRSKDAVRRKTGRNT